MAGAVAASVIGCDTRPPNALPESKLPDQNTLVTFIGPAWNEPQWRAIVAGARRHADALGLRLTAIESLGSTDAEIDAALEKLKQQEPSAVCLLTVNPRVARPLAQRVSEQVGAAIVTVGAAIDLPSAYGHVEVNWPGGGDLLGSHLPRMVGDGQSYVLLHDDGLNPHLSTTHARFFVESRLFFNVTKLEERTSAFEAQAGIASLRAMLEKYRNASLVITLMPNVWLAAAPDTLLPPQTNLATLGAMPELWPLLESGRAAALVGPLDGEIGLTALHLAIDAVTGSRRTGAVRLVDCELVTKDSLPDFAARYAEALGMTVDVLRSRGLPQP